MMATMSDLKVYERLAIVTLTGFDGSDSAVDPETGYSFATGGVDLPGSANHLCEAYGMGEVNESDGGILWTDYDLGGDWTFSVLIDAVEVEALKATATEAGYEVDEIDEVSEPIGYGDGHGGTVEILKHRDGWVILPR